MSQPDDGRYKSRGRKERTPEQLKVLAMAREKAKLVIKERTKAKKELAGPNEFSLHCLPAITYHSPDTKAVHRPRTRFTAAPASIDQMT